MTPSLDLAACASTAWQPTPAMAIRVAIAAGLLALGGWSLARHAFPGQRAFATLSVVMAAWITFSVTEHAAVDAGCKGTVALLSWAAILAQPPLWALFLYQYLHGDPAAPGRRTRMLLALPSLLLLAAAWSNGQHGLWYGEGTTLGPPIAGLPRLRYEYGPLFFAGVTIGYGWTLLSFGLTLKGRNQARRGDRTQWNAFLLMMSVPLLANLTYLGWGFRLFGADPTSTAFAVALVGFAWMIARNRVFDLVPLARRLLFSELPSPVLVLTPELRVIEANRAAHALAGGVQGDGTPLAQWPVVGPTLTALLQPGVDSTLAPVHVAGRWFDVQQQTLDHGGRQLGQLVLLVDVTRRHHAAQRMELDLAARDAEQLRLRDEALRDPLTGIWNRRALQERFSAAASPGAPLVLVLLDLDHFKRVNDEHGHAVGDAVLRDFAAELRTTVRAGDAVFRIGGEEFALLLPGLDADQAVQRMQRLHEHVNAHSLGGRPAGQTFSAGIAASPPQAAELDTLLRSADAALYRAKAEGRDRSCVA